MSTKTATPWYAIRRRTAMAAAAIGVAAAAEIYIYGDIGESWWEETVSAASFVRELGTLDVEAITVRINSIGGSVSDGLAIFNAMRRHKATITTEVDGVAFSIASLIAMGGDRVHMASNAMLMIHAPWTYAAGNSAEFRELADQLDTWAAAMSTSYAARTGDQPAMLALVTDGKDHYYTAEEALAAKFIDAVTDAMPVAASAARDLPLNRYRSLPASLQASAVSAAPAASSAADAAPSADEDPMKIRKTALLMAALGALGVAAGGGNPAPADPGAANPAPGAAAGAGAATVDAAARDAVLAADRTRRETIRANFQPLLAHAGAEALMRRCEDDTSCTPEAAGQRLLAHLGASATPIAGNITGVVDEADKQRGAMTEALLARANVVLAVGQAPVRADTSNPFRGRKLLALAEACLIRAGIRTDGMDQRTIVATAFTQSGSDFPILLENTMHKALQAAYAVQPDTWTLFCARGTVSDFRAHSRYRVGSLSNLDSKNELGEYKNKTIPDGEKGSITAGTKGNIINVSREAVINDDLGAFVGLAQSLGRAAKRTVEADVYATLALNSGLGPVLSDGQTLFHASHSNIASAAAPTVTSFDAAKVLMASQKDVGGNDFLDLNPAIWLGPKSLEGTAKVINNSEFDPDAANKLQRVNMARGVVQTIVGTPRLSSAPWYFFADPNVAPVLEVAFLDGVSDPFLEMETAFSTDGARWKVRMDYGVAGVDFRGAVRNAGA